MVRAHGSEAANIITHPDQYTAVEVPGDAVPHERLERYDANSLSKLRAATAEELTAYDAQALSTRCEAESMTPVVLASCAVAVRERDPAAWDAMDHQQQKDAVKTEAAAWKTMRELFDGGCH
jgi:hypothetical protein